MADYEAPEEDERRGGQVPAPSEPEASAPRRDAASGQTRPEPPSGDRPDLCMLALFFDLFQMELSRRLLCENGIAAEQRGNADIGYSLFVEPDQAERAHKLLDAFLADAPAAQAAAASAETASDFSEADGQSPDADDNGGFDADADGSDLDDLDDDEIGETLTLRGFLMRREVKPTSIVLFLALPIGALLLILFLQWLASFL